MTNFDAISAKLKTGTDFITDKSSVLTNLFDSVKKIVPKNSYSVSKPIKTNEGIEIKAGEKSIKSSDNFVGKIMNKKVLMPVLIIAGIYFGFRKLTKVK